MIFRHFAWYAVVILVVVAATVNPAMSLMKALQIGVLPMALLGGLASRWQLNSSRWRIVLISAVSGAIAAAAAGILLFLGRPPIGLPSPGLSLNAVAFALAVAFGLIGLVPGLIIGFFGASATIIERKFSDEQRSGFEQSQLRLYFIAVAGILFAFLYSSGNFGQPPQFRPISLCLGVLLGYTLLANERGAGLTLFVISWILFFEVVQHGPSGWEFKGWGALWQFVHPQLGWFLLGGCVSSAVTSFAIKKFDLRLTVDQLVDCLRPWRSTYDKHTEQRARMAEQKLFLHPQFPQDVVVEALLKGLNRDNTRVREVCIAKLKEVPTSERVFDAMVRGLADTDSWVRQGAQSFFLFKTRYLPPAMRERARSALNLAKTSADAESEKSFIEEVLNQNHLNG